MQDCDNVFKGFLDVPSGEDGHVEDSLIIKLKAKPSDFPMTSWL
jgi:hypothetical protein